MIFFLFGRGSNGQWAELGDYILWEAVTYGEWSTDDVL